MDNTIELGIVGLGKMGANMTRRLLAGGHKVVVYDRNAQAVEAAADAGATPTGSPEDLVSWLIAPRAIWIMVPSGDPTEQTVTRLSELLERDDAIIDGGNSNYKDTIRRAETLADQGLHFVDVGTSGGIWGVTEGYSMMVGGEAGIVEQLKPIFETLAPSPDRGWGHVGPSGAGHFVKMVHNGIEYGLMQAYAEGFELMGQKAEFGLDLHQVAEIWREGSVVRSWLLDLAASALAEDASLEKVSPYVADSGEGRWTVAEAIEVGCSIPVITAALQQRFRSQAAESFGDKLLSALRNQFGGHGLEHSS